MYNCQRKKGEKAGTSRGGRPSGVASVEEGGRDTVGLHECVQEYDV